MPCGNALRKSNSQPLCQADVQPLTSWCTTLWQPAKYAVSWSSWSLAKMTSFSSMQNSSEMPMFKPWRAGVQLFDIQPTMKSPGQAEVKSWGTRSEVLYLTNGQAKMSSMNRLNWVSDLMIQFKIQDVPSSLYTSVSSHPNSCQAWFIPSCGLKLRQDLRVGKWSKSWDTEYVGHRTDEAQSEMRKGWDAEQVRCGRDRRQNRWDAEQMRQGADETWRRWDANGWVAEQMIQRTDQRRNRWDVGTNETWNKTNAVYRHSMAALRRVLTVPWVSLCQIHTRKLTNFQLANKVIIRVSSFLDFFRDWTFCPHSNFQINEGARLS